MAAGPGSGCGISWPRWPVPYQHIGAGAYLRRIQSRQYNHIQCIATTQPLMSHTNTRGGGRFRTKIAVKNEAISRDLYKIQLTEKSRLRGISAGHVSSCNPLTWPRVMFGRVRLQNGIIAGDAAKTFLPGTNPRLALILFAMRMSVDCPVEL